MTRYHSLDAIKKMLLDPKYDPSVNNYEVMKDASYFEDFEIVRLLLLDYRFLPSLRIDFFSRFGIQGLKIKAVLNRMIKDYKNRICDICFSLSTISSSSRPISALELALIIEYACPFAYHFPFHSKWNMITKIIHSKNKVIV